MPESEAERATVGFGRLAVAVAIVTTLDGEHPHGSTGMAWAEHADPPLLLTTLKVAGRTRELVAATGVFGVSVLADGQVGYVKKFASKSRVPGDRFEGVDHTRGERLGVPLLTGCVANFECEVRDIHPFGGHDIVVGNVVSTLLTTDDRALVHYDGHLWSLNEVTP
ncbi:MAG: flavin reductase [Streptosporangiales bacterium]|nr:flavin reductase [Streptosporangiales bacterium]